MKIKQNREFNLDTKFISYSQQTYAKKIVKSILTP